IETAGGAEIAADASLRGFVEFLAHATGGRRGRGERRHQREPARGGAVDHAAETGRRAAVYLEQLAAVTELTRLELTPVRRERAEGVRLVGQHRDEGAHVTSWGTAAR